jgi:hypothetical protein
MAFPDGIYPIPRARNFGAYIFPVNIYFQEKQRKSNLQFMTSCRNFDSGKTMIKLRFFINIYYNEPNIAHTKNHIGLLRYLYVDLLPRLKPEG